MNKNFLTGAQIRAARALLRWPAERLAAEARLGRITISRAESLDGRTALTNANEHAVREAFERHGIEFIPRNGKGEGVRLRQPSGAAEPGAAAADEVID